MRFLLDTDVLSQFQPRTTDRRVAQWLDGHRPDELHLSVLSVGEVRRGATNLRHRGDLPQAAALDRWLGGLLETFQDRIVPVTLDVVEVWGDLGIRNMPPAVDGLIAATAVVHGMTVVTRNVKQFGLTGVRMVDPFRD